MFETLTSTQIEILKLNAVGLSSCEIADKMDISEETAKTHIKNIKQRTGLQKATELVALYWCTIFGESLEEKRKQILASVMLFLFIVSVIPYEQNEEFRESRTRVTRTRVSTRRYNYI